MRPWPRAAFAAIYLLSNCVFLHATEVNIWGERKKSLAQTQFAGLPASMLNMPTPQAFSAVVSKQIQKEIPKYHEQRLSPVLKALSSNYGTVRQISSPAPGRASSKIVVHIQDIHLNPEAQENIGKTVAGLIEKKSIGLIGLEGAFAPIELNSVRSFEDKKATEIVAEYLLRENRISGAVYAAYIHPDEIPAIIGVDEKTHYNANILAYQSSLSRKDMDVKKINTRMAELQQSQTSLNPTLSAFHAQVMAHQEGQLPFGEYVQILAKHGPDHSSDIDVFLEAYAMEKSLNFPRVESERAALLSQLIPKLSKAESDQLLSTSMAFRMGQISQTDFYSYLSRICRDKETPLSQFKAMNAYVQYVLLSDAIHPEKLMRAVADLEKAAYASLAKTALEKDWVRESKQLVLARKLLDYALTPDEWDQYKDGKEKMAALDLSTYERFYIEAEARNESIASNLLNAMERENANVAVLVTGGFHSPGIDQLLKDAGVSTITFAPKISKVETDDGAPEYLSVFAQAKTPLDQLFSGEKLFVSPNPNGAVPSVTSALQRATSQKLANPAGPNSATIPGNSGELTVQFAAGPKIETVKYSPRFDPMGRILRFVTSAIKSWKSVTALPTLEQIKTGNQLSAPSDVLGRVKNWPDSAVKNDGIRKKLKALFKAPQNRGLEVIVVQGGNGEATLGGNQMARYYDESDRNNPHAVIVIEQKFISLTLNANQSDPILQKAAERIFMERFFHELAHGNTALDLENEILEETLVMRNIDWELWAYAGGFNYPGIYSLLNEELPLESSAHISGAWKYKEFKRIWEEIRTLGPGQKETHLIRELKKMATNVVGENPTPGAKSWGAPAQAAGQEFNKWRKGRTDEILVSFDDKTAPIRISHYEAVRDLDKGLLKLDVGESKFRKLVVNVTKINSFDAYKKHLADMKNSERVKVEFNGSKDLVEVSLAEALRDEEAGFLVLNETTGQFVLDPVASTKNKLDRLERKEIMRQFLARVMKGAKERGTPAREVFPLFSHNKIPASFALIRADQVLQFYDEGIIAPWGLKEEQFIRSKAEPFNLVGMVAEYPDEIPYDDPRFDALKINFVLVSLTPSDFTAKVKKLRVDYFGNKTIAGMGIKVFEVNGRVVPGDKSFTPSQIMRRVEVVQEDIRAGELDVEFTKDGGFDRIVTTRPTKGEYDSYRDRLEKIAELRKGLSDKKNADNVLDVYVAADKKNVSMTSAEARALLEAGVLDIKEKDSTKYGKDIVVRYEGNASVLTSVRAVEKERRLAREKPDEKVKVGGLSGIDMTRRELAAALNEGVVSVDAKGALSFSPGTKPQDYKKTLEVRAKIATFEKTLDGNNPIAVTDVMGKTANVSPQIIKAGYPKGFFLFDPDKNKVSINPKLDQVAYGAFLVGFKLDKKIAEMEKEHADFISARTPEKRTYFTVTAPAGSILKGTIEIRSFQEVKAGYADGRFGYDEKNPTQLKPLTAKTDYEKHITSLRSGTTLNTVIGNRGWLSYLVTYTGAKYIYEHATAAVARMLGYDVTNIQTRRTVGQVTIEGRSAAVAVAGPLVSLMTAIIFSLAGTAVALADTDGVTKIVVAGLALLVGTIPNLLMAANLALVKTPGSRGFEIVSMVVEYRQRKADRQAQLDEMAQIFSEALTSNIRGRLDASLLARIQNVPVSLDQIGAKQRGDGGALSNKEKSYVERKAAELSRGKAVQMDSFGFAAMATLLSQLGATWFDNDTKLNAKRAMALTFSDEQSAVDQLGELRKALGDNNRMVIALVSSDQRRDELEYWTSEKTSIRFYSPRDGYVAGASFDLNAIINFVINQTQITQDEINNTTFATPDGEFNAEWIPDLGLLQTLSKQGYDIRFQQRSLLLGNMPIAPLNVSNVLELMRHIAKFA